MVPSSPPTIPDIVDAVTAAGGRAILTGDHPSGTDRCAEAFRHLGPAVADHGILNLQGDEPFRAAHPQPCVPPCALDGPMW